ncbi:MAG: decaprenyl-phosphate phosphoribosyltransferase [Frankiales bacterium]|nr:decaprenyl-phosphate phosphoribosyltransferase [Frankiales bacterium]
MSRTVPTPPATGGAVPEPPAPLEDAATPTPPAVVGPAPTVEPSGPAPHRRRGRVAALVVALRPRQWVKNLLVYAVPLAAGKLGDRDVVADTTVAFLCFCAVASATYLLNDVRDVEADRAHPRKRLRPIAAGELSSRAAVVWAVLLAGAGLLGAALSTYPGFLVTLAVYLIATLAYSYGLKHEPVIELAVIAAGFVLRAIAGGTATGIPMSPWFLTVAAFGSLFMAAGKRYSEYVQLGEEGRAARPALARYTATYLRFVWSLAAAIVLTAYCLWAFQLSVRDRGAVPLAAWSVVPFILAVLRFALDVDRGDAGAPEDIALGDRVLQVIAVVWLVMFALGSAGI